MVWDLIADIGGTNMRLAAVIDGEIAHRITHETSGALAVTEGLSALCRHMATSPRRVWVAAAGVVRGGYVQLTNGGQGFSERDLLQATGAETARIMNDFEAAAWSLVSPGQADLLVLQGDAPEPEGRTPRLIVGPGTGLGVGSLVWRGDCPVVVPGEGGHVRIAPRHAQDIPLFETLGNLWPETRMAQGQEGHLALEAEAIISGTGIPVLMRALCQLHGREEEVWDAAAVFEAARLQSDPLASEAVELLCTFLGAVAGDLALVVNARGGVFLCGGVLAGNAWIFDRPTFLDAFNQGGRHTVFRKTLPIYLYRDAKFGLNGVLNAMSHQ
ncbi:glucokinase [Coralliovum pocilloporae]|uniref:glucokinase n=1 Tax=Coralliovum pocilloporae TaxID=3066369 RepID=UPI0033079653